MWNHIEQAISQATNTDFHINDKAVITGGDINLSYSLTNSTQQFFVKINDKQNLSLFEAEAFALQQINAQSPFHSPMPICYGETLDKSFLVLEMLDLISANNEQWFELGQQLAIMHKQSQHGQFGWDEDNYIGSNLQPNAWSSNWSVFFAEQRIAWQLQLLSEKSIRLGDIEHISQMCHDGLQHHRVSPCLIHGDLWQGNVGFTNSGPTIFDPASYYGDREADIAMTELFGQFPAAFYQGYEEQYPLPKHYEQRKQIYNFYHVLNHANLFGGVYIEQAKAIMQRILSMSFH
ncbi:fructosamine kinase family protein [Thalassotalea atypica]|uniref:fructosamine kinase family protein n=1 Tax=Thalassotalea atypica TaxID=2054316 RepID=UPI00257365BC|nr:fructosamine kinase family protein [Thalassotalea atypica]